MQEAVDATVSKADVTPALMEFTRLRKQTGASINYRL